ncbi:MAG: NUDIX domain-containing protein [Flavobacteriaceae bacterium]|nr:NUDIX domain-containing protein [Flavobacteriaceae bacterium]
MEKNDIDMAFTALRETYEETGINQKDVNLIRQITNTYIPPSNFLVHTFLATVPFKPEFKKNHEVEEILEIPVSELLNDRSLTTKRMSTSYMEEINIPCFQLNNHIVWGYCHDIK